jgi:hypothetical protein
VAGGQTAFFAEFAFCSDQELLFMRHAPGQMGDAEWFDDRGFQRLKSRPSRAPDLSAEGDLRVLDPINARHGSARGCSDRQALAPVVLSRSRSS